MISIITPVYKAAPYIRQTFDSVLAQSFGDWEWILVDDHSPDDTVTVIRGLLTDISEDIRDRITLITLDENAGAAHARNVGLDRARGRYIAFLDADDVWLPDRLQISMDHMSATGAGFVYTAYEFGDEHASGTGRIVHVLPQLTYRMALSRTIIFTTTTLFDTRLIPIELLHMPEIESEDTATWWQILKAGHTAYGCDRVTAVYRRPASGSLSSNKLVAVRRIWNLYRNTEHLSVARAAWYFSGWALRATLRRL